MTQYRFRSRSVKVITCTDKIARAWVKVVQGCLTLFLLTQQNLHVFSSERYQHTKPLTRTINFSLSVHSITKLISHPSECSFDNTAHKIISQDTINITRNVSLLINLFVCFFKNLIYKVGHVRIVIRSCLTSQTYQTIPHTFLYIVLSLAVDILVWHAKSKNNLNCDNGQ